MAAATSTNDTMALMKSPIRNLLPFTVKTIAEKSGYLGDLKARTFQKQGDANAPNYPTAWLPTARVAERWQWLVTEKP